MGLETAVALASLGMSAYQGLKGAQSEAAANQAAQNAANEAARIAEADKFKSLQVPTLGLQLAQQNEQARQAQDLQGLRDIGAAGVLGGLTAVNQQGRAEDLALSAEAQNAQYQRDLMQAQNAQQIEQGRMQREFAMNQAKLAGAQAAASEGRQNQNAAIQGGLTALSNLATIKAYKDVNADKEGGGGTPPPKTQSYNTGTTQSATPVAQATTQGYSSTNPNMAAYQAAFAPTISGMPQGNVDLSALAGLRGAQTDYEKWLGSMQTGDPLNDMYQRKALLGQ